MDKMSAIKELFINRNARKQSLSVECLKYGHISACVDIACKEKDQINAIKKNCYFSYQVWGILEQDVL